MPFYDSCKWWQPFSNFSCDNIIIESSLSEKILGFTIDNNLDFSYCPLIWMFCNRKSMKKVSKIQERYLHLVTHNYELNYEELLDLTNEISLQQRCLNSLMTEVYKCLNGLSPDIRNDILAVSKHQYNTRHYNLFVTGRPKPDRYCRN